MSKAFEFSAEKLELAQHPLAKPEQPNRVLHAALQTPEALKLASGVLAVEASATVAVDLFNAANDQDVSGVFGKPGLPEDPSQRSSVLHWSEGEAWLKYGVTARAKATAAGEFPFAAVGGEAEVQVLLASYRHHPAKNKLLEALTKDAVRTRFGMVAEDLEGLGPKDAFSLHANLALKTSVTLKWSDVLSTNLRGLAQWFPKDKVVAIQVGPSASVKAEVTTKDEFVTVFSSANAGRVRIQLRKAKARGATLGTEIKAEVGVEGLKPLLQNLLSHDSVTQVETFLAELAKKKPAEWALLGAQKLLGRFGIDVELAPAELKEAFAKLQEALVSLAGAKVTAGFSYEYGRLSEDATLLELELPLEHAKAAHALLVSGRVDVVQAQHASALTRFFRHESDTWSQAWGFSLGLGEKTLATSKERKELKCVTQYSTPNLVTGPRRHAYQGLRNYQREGVLSQGQTVFWSFDFKAELNGFFSHPKAADFDFGLYLLRRTRGAFHEETVRDAIDGGVVWGVLDDTDEEAIYEKAKKLAGKKPLETRLELKVPNALLRDLLPDLALGGREVFARALARAMPWQGSMPTTRAVAPRRQAIYWELWDAYLKAEGRDWTLDYAQRATEHHLKKSDAAKGVDWVEAKYEGTGGPGSLAWLLRTDSASGAPMGGMPLAGIHDDWRAFARGCGRLLTGITQQQGIPSRAEDSVIAESFGMMEGIFNNHFPTVAMGAWLVALASEEAHANELERTFTLQQFDNKGEGGEAIVLGSAR